MMITLRILCILGLLGLVYGAIGGNKEKMDKMDPESKEYQTTGVLLMDSITFNKLVPNKNADMVLMVAAKGNVGKRTTDYMRDEFLQMAKKASKKARRLAGCQMARWLWLKMHFNTLETK